MGVIVTKAGAGSTTSTTTREIFNEVPSGSINGSNVTFALSIVPNPSTSLRVYLNGLRMLTGSNNDYVISGSQSIVFNLPAPETNSNIIVDYKY